MTNSQNFNVKSASLISKLQVFRNWVPGTGLHSSTPKEVDKTCIKHGTTDTDRLYPILCKPLQHDKPLKVLKKFIPFKDSLTKSYCLFQGVLRMQSLIRNKL